MEVTNYKCPSCGGTLTFNSDKQKMYCEHCSNEYEVDVIKQYNSEIENSMDSGESFNWNSYESNVDEDAEMNMFVCPACGAQIVADETTVATKCVYCDNDAVLSQKLRGVNRPDYVIPFKVGKGRAQEELKNFYKGKLLLPKMFRHQNRIESIMGLYVPFWLFDCDTHAYITYNAKKIHTYTSGDYEVTKTEHYLVSRTGDIGFEKVPVDGSTKAPDDYMESIEPFNYDDLVEYDGTYLSGYFADKYDVDSEASKPRADKRVKNSTIDAFKSTVVGYDIVDTKTANIQINQGNIKYALLPVWMLNTKYNDKIYTFAMNGQTGRFVGELPASKAKSWTFFFIFFAVVFALTYYIEYLFF